MNQLEADICLNEGHGKIGQTSVLATGVDERTGLSNPPDAVIPDSHDPPTPPIPFPGVHRDYRRTQGSTVDEGSSVGFAAAHKGEIAMKAGIPDSRMNRTWSFGKDPIGPFGGREKSSRIYEEPDLPVHGPISQFLQLLAREKFAAPIRVVTDAGRTATGQNVDAHTLATQVRLLGPMSQVSRQNRALIQRRGRRPYQVEQEKKNEENQREKHDENRSCGGPEDRMLSRHDG